MNTVYLGADEADEAIRGEKWHQTPEEQDPEPLAPRQDPEERDRIIAAFLSANSTVEWLAAHGRGPDGHFIRTEEA